MSGGTGYDLHFSKLLQALESLNQVPIITIKECVAHLEKPFVVHVSQGIEFGLRLSSFDFFFRQFRQPLKSVHITGLQKRINEHRRESGSDR